MPGVNPMGAKKQMSGSEGFSCFLEVFDMKLQFGTKPYHFCTKMWEHHCTHAITS